MKTLVTIICLGLAILVGCATPYQPKGFKGGYSEVQLGANTFRVNFRGNAYTSRERVDTLLLYRCAELTVQNGYDYFIVVREDSEARTDTHTTPTTFSAKTTHFGFGSKTTGSVNPGQTFRSRKYSGMAMIKLFRGEKPVDRPTAYNAQELMQVLQRQYSELRKASTAD